MESVKKVELLAPAGNFEKLEIAIHYGANAVYLGGKRFSLRNFSGNFTLEQIKAGIDYAHERKVKVYVAVNIYPRDHEIDAIKEYLQKLGEIVPDGIIVADPGIFTLAKRNIPHVCLHVSTQANTTHLESVRFWEEMGAKRVNLARELSLAEIENVARRSDIEIEAFVHGAMCISYSGRCLLSSYMAGRESNRGMCCHPCRWKYAVVEEKRPGEFYPVGEDRHGTYVFNSKDLCMIENIPEMIRAGIRCLKIEGRMKGIHYLAATVKTYREAIDSYYRDPENHRVEPDWKKELSNVSHRDFCKGFYFNDPEDVSPFLETDKTVIKQLFIGKVIRGEKDRGALIDVRNKVFENEPIEILSAKGLPAKSIISEIVSTEGIPMAYAQPGSRVYLKMDRECETNDLIRRFETGR